jgi:hypothetical protein
LADISRHRQSIAGSVGGSRLPEQNYPVGRDLDDIPTIAAMMQKFAISVDNVLARSAPEI